MGRAKKSASQPPALELTGVSHSFDGTAALDDVSFSIPQASFCALLGPNGAGKTTLLSLVTRLYACQAGTIKVFGEDLHREPGAALSRLGVVFQQRTLDLDLTITQNLHYQGALHGMSAAETRERVDEEIARLDLTEMAGTKLRKLSGGQARRVEIARALLHRPSLLLLDEPTVGLDPATRTDIHLYIRSLCAKGVAVLWCTHLIDEVVPDSQLLILDRGKALANDIASKVQKQTGAKTIEAAFTKLTGRNNEAMTAVGR
jgi:ABC-2 type transport system ATP-binding protein